MKKIRFNAKKYENRLEKCAKSGKEFQESFFGWVEIISFLHWTITFSDFKLAKHGKIGMEQIRKAYNKWINEHLMGCGTPFKGHENRQQLVRRFCSSKSQ